MRSPRPHSAVLILALPLYEGVAATCWYETEHGSACPGCLALKDRLPEPPSGFTLWEG